MKSLMLKSVYAELDGKPPPLIVDLGYWDDESASRFVALRNAGVARCRFTREGHDRLLCELPPRTATAILGKLPIVEGSTYWRTTHHWRGLGECEDPAPSDGGER